MFSSPPFQVSALLHHATMQIEEALTGYFNQDNRSIEIMEQSVVTAIRRGWQLIQISRHQKHPDEHARYLIALAIQCIYLKAMKKFRPGEEVCKDTMLILTISFTELMFNEEREPITVESLHEGALRGEAMANIQKSVFSRYEPSLN